MCSKEELQELKQLKSKEMDAEEYRREVQEQYKIFIEKEQAQRELMITQARRLQEVDKDWLRQSVEGMAGLSDEEIDAAAIKMERLARSPHPLEGFWDSHGRPIAN